MKEARVIEGIPPEDPDNLLCHFFIKVTFSRLEVYLETEIIYLLISL